MKVLITGGAGFIGSNTADRLLMEGEDVVIVDNLSRPGSEKNLAWLRQNHGEFPFSQVDVRDSEALERTFADAGEVQVILHLAAQVAVTSSVTDPRYDFEVNALGSLNVLEAARRHMPDAVMLLTSTNKVYGALSSFAVKEDASRYRFVDLAGGVPETIPLDFYSPYGCSKGAADQYFLDYHRIYGLRTIVFRNSCIYGRRQFGIEDQGWLAWFVIAAVHGRPITIYGDGKQVRDVLFVDDLIEAMLRAVRRPEVTQGQAYNIGGGPDNSLSVWNEFGPLLAELAGRPIEVALRDWRPGDQRVYISDVSKAGRDFGWAPSVNVREGIRRLFDWVSDNPSLFTRS
jgi:CDP-paratose 2-epimerase